MDQDLTCEILGNIPPSLVVLLTPGDDGDIVADPEAAGLFGLLNNLVAMMEVR